MAQETGIILTLDFSGKVQIGTLSRDNGLTPNPIPFDATNLFGGPIVLNIGDAVSYDFDPQTATASNINPIVADPDFPADQGTVISSPYNGDLVLAAGTITTISGTTVSGSITLNGGTLILKSSTQGGTVPAVIQGDLRGMKNSNVTIYKSQIAGSLLFHNSGALTIKGGSVGGDTDIHNSQRIKNQGSVGGDTDIKNCQVVLLSNLNITGAGNNFKLNNNTSSTVASNITVANGDAIIKNNTGCSYTNITAPQGNITISGCTGS
ncbi:MAG TPA: hypothetical protein VNZ86_10765 [Bacteroidia bacterium]|jgi:hypothetical protein|nr:hypothetical protein [Bacteroidia bacterium]